MNGKYDVRGGGGGVECDGGAGRDCRGSEIAHRGARLDRLDSGQAAETHCRFV